MYALKMAKDISALKAVSQNLMHKNLSTTDGVYGILSEMDVRNEIGKLGTRLVSTDEADIGRRVANLEKIILSG